MAEACRAAVAAGLEEIGFAEHFDLLPDDPSYGFFRADDWWEEVGRCRQSFAGQLAIRAGIELGEPHRFPAMVAELLDRYPWDYSLGSVHWVAGTLIWDPAYFARSASRAYADYFTELGQMAASGGFDALAHMDAIKHYGSRHYGPFDPRQYEHLIRPILGACARQGIALEVNTGLLRRPVAELSPERTILAWYLEEGGERVIIGSDAHLIQDVGFGLSLALNAIRAAGFDQITGYDRRGPYALPIGAAE
jgi:histidinol-phosphatase (PHP family)